MDIVEQITKAEAKFKPWASRVDKILKRYADKRTSESAAFEPRRMNILWSNVQTLMPSLYARTPEPEVVRRQKDGDPIGRTCAILLERALENHLDSQDFSHLMRQTTMDYLLGGRGVSRVRMRDGAATMQHVQWRDFGHLPARKWEEVPGVWFKQYLTRPQLRKHFGAKGADAPLDHKPDTEEMTSGDSDQKATIYEFWDRPSRTVKWISCGSEKGGVLLEKEDPLHLEGFWPCPRPLYATLTPDSLIPTPDYAQYQDQAEEIDLLTERIGKLTSSLRVAGVYDSANGDEVKRLLQVDSELIPVDSFAAFAQKGGVQGVIVWLPIDMIIAVLQGCYEARDRAKMAMYEITGISDVLRGATDPNETATAQNIKAQWGGLRVRDRQSEVQRFARDMVRLNAELIAEHYDAQKLVQIAQYMPKPIPAQTDPQGQVIALEVTPEQQIQQAMQILQSDKLRGYYVDIQTDSTLEADEQQEKQEANEFLAVFSQLMERAVGMMTASPASAPMIKAVIMATVRRYRFGRAQEETIEQSLDDMIKGASQPQPDPKAMEAQGKMQLEQARLQMDGQRMQMDQQAQQVEMQMKQQEAAQRAQIEAAKAQQDAALSQADAQAKQQQAVQQFQIDQMKLQMDGALKREELAMKERLGVMELRIKYGLQSAELDMKEEAMERDSEIKREAAGGEE